MITEYNHEPALGDLLKLLAPKNNNAGFTATDGSDVYDGVSYE